MVLRTLVALDESVGVSRRAPDPPPSTPVVAAVAVQPVARLLGHDAAGRTRRRLQHGLHGLPHFGDLQLGRHGAGCAGREARRRVGHRRLASGWPVSAAASGSSSLATQRRRLMPLWVRGCTCVRLPFGGLEGAGRVPSLRSSLREVRKHGGGERERARSVFGSTGVRGPPSCEVWEELLELPFHIISDSAPSKKRVRFESFGESKSGAPPRLRRFSSSSAPTFPALLIVSTQRLCFGLRCPRGEELEPLWRHAESHRCGRPPNRH